MEIKIDEYGFIFDTEILSINFQRSGIIALAVIFAVLQARRLYLDKKAKKAAKPAKRGSRLTETN